MKLKIGFVLFILLLINTVSVYADTNPCDSDDPACPLDSWTLVLFFAALVLGSYHLYRRQKTRSI